VALTDERTRPRADVREAEGLLRSSGESGEKHTNRNDERQTLRLRSVVDFRPSRKSKIPARRAGAVKVRSAAERGVGAERRGLDGAEDRPTLERVMAADRQRS